ncbi:MAG: hypothetical protein PHI28_01900 [Mangrovibacterium sp.]|nr:hypothetical protein [Mangrovibacterium sp.]
MSKIIQFLDTHFGAFLIAGLVMGLINPALSGRLMPLLEPGLGLYGNRRPT